MTQTKTLSHSPLVSIITVTFNLIKAGRENYIRQSIESVHQQNYANFEHIIIDGGSTDGTLDILEEYAAQGWIKYYSEPDNGIFDAMNKGIKKAVGKYVAFLNSDDFYHDYNAVSSSVAALEKHKADFSYAACTVVNDKKNECEYSDCDLGRVFNSAPFYHLTMFTKRDVLLKENMFNTDYQVAADSDLILRLCLKGYKPCKVSLNFATYRRCGASDNQVLCIRELTEIYYKNYNKLCRVSIAKCQKMVWSHQISFRLFKKIVFHCNWRVGLSALRFHYFSKQGIRAVINKKNKDDIYHIFAGFKNAHIAETAVLMEGMSIQNPYDNKITIGHKSMLQCHLIFESDQGEIEIGPKVAIGGSTLICRSKIVIEEGVHIAWSSTIYDHNSHSLSYKERRKDFDRQYNDYVQFGDPIRNKDWSTVKSRPITIKKDAWIGMGCIIMHGVTIGERAIIGAGTVVREDVAPGAIMIGNPAIVTGYIDDED